jgi:hypothetical protein
MANVDKTRSASFHQKKSESIFAGVVVEGTGIAQIASGSGNFLIANLPPRSIATNAYIHTLVVSDAATSNVVTLGTTEGGSEIMSAGDITSLGESGTLTGQVSTGTGVSLYLGVTTTGAATDVAEYVVVVEYLEFGKTTGEYTKISK